MGVMSIEVKRNDHVIVGEHIPGFSSFCRSYLYGDVQRGGSYEEMYGHVIFYTNVEHN
jgi:hypothetical protein